MIRAGRLHDVPYEVSTPVFEGPFDLLLHLILKEEVDLWEISLARIVDAFCAEVERMERVDLDVATEFLLIAATLVELKARRLLPGRDDVDLDEELLRFEERDLLLARLLECKTFQDAARCCTRADRRGRAAASPRTAGPEEPFRSLAPDPLERIPLDALLAAARRGLAPKPPPEVDTDHVAPIRASVRDAIETVLALLPASGSMRFRDSRRCRARSSRSSCGSSRCSSCSSRASSTSTRPRTSASSSCVRSRRASASRSTSRRSTSGATPTSRATPG